MLPLTGTAVLAPLIAFQVTASQALTVMGSSRIHAEFVLPNVGPLQGKQKGVQTPGSDIKSGRRRFMDFLEPVFN